MDFEFDLSKTNGGIVPVKKLQGVYRKWIGIAKCRMQVEAQSTKVKTGKGYKLLLAVPTAYGMFFCNLCSLWVYVDY